MVLDSLTFLVAIPVDEKAVRPMDRTVITRWPLGRVAQAGWTEVPINMDVYGSQPDRVTKLSVLCRRLISIQGDR
jgi:hypothetical protein